MLQSEHVSQLVMIPGIITAASKPRHSPSTVTVMCRDCRLETKFNTVPGVGINLPRQCNLAEGVPGMVGTKCSLDPWVILPSKSQFADQQTLKLQASQQPSFLVCGILCLRSDCSRYVCFWELLRTYTVVSFMVSRGVDAA